MKSSHILFIAGIVCLMVLFAGCTGTTQTKTAATSTATAAETPVVTATTAAAETTAAATTSATEAAATAAANATATATPAAFSWAGTWNTTYSSAQYGEVAETLTMTQNGTAITGTYALGNGTIEATLADGILSGSWKDVDANGTYAGLFEFTPSTDGKSFTGKWISANETTTLKNTTQYWNGARV